ncbi:MAG TPA: PLP-dependent aminotransferase family protein [Burkholderiaceae bacterium]|nr:PLP-dependent aminotransferase family protein [Burkholderiaceae bacterium]
MRTPLGQIWRSRLEQTPAGPSLTDRIARMLIAAIRARVLVPGSALPSSRELAAELGVARNTAVAALERLVAEGLLESRPRSGFFVGETAGDAWPRSDPMVALGELAAPVWGARFRLQPGRQRTLAKPLDWERYRYPFVYGQVDPALFPHAEWRDCCDRALRGHDAREALIDQVDRDDPLLVEQIRTRLLPRRGVWARDSEILVTLGAQHALYLVASLLAGRGTTVGIEDPCYPDARNIFALFGARLRPLPIDAQGMRISHGLAGCDYLYLTPSHQCPTTVTMPIERRRALIEFAAANDCVLIEDDFEPEASYEGPPTPALKSLDLAGRVVYVGSLSKTLAPGIRLGCVVGPTELIAELRRLRRLMLRHPPTAGQRALALFLAEGHLDSLARRLRGIWRERASRLATAIDHHLPDWSYTPPRGGSALWAQLPPDLDTDRLAESASRHGALVEPGSVFFARARDGRHGVRLGLSSIATERIEPGVIAIASAAADARLVEPASPPR